MEGRRAAAESCGFLQEFDAVASLLSAADDVHFRVRAAVAWALGEIGGQDVQKVLETLAKDRSSLFDAPPSVLSASWHNLGCSVGICLSLQMGHSMTAIRRDVVCYQHKSADARDLKLDERFTVIRL